MMHPQPIPSNDYTVLFGERELPVYTCRISAFPFNSHWPGHQRPLDQTVTASFVSITAEEAVSLTVIPHIPCEEPILKPRSKEIPLLKDGNKLQMTFSKAGGYVLMPGHYAHCLYIFINRPIAAPDPNTVTHFFGPGVHHPGKITLRSNESLYVDRDAYVFGCIYAENAENIHIFGNGIFDDTMEKRTGASCFDTNGNVKLKNCRNVQLEGVGFTNSATWCVSMFGCQDISIDSIRVFGQWRYNTDGVDMVNSARVTVKNSFIHSFDDCLVIKGMPDYNSDICEDILAEHNTLWCDWGKTMELGLETFASEFRRITFRDCDVIRGGNTVCDIQNGDCACVSDVLFENIRIEFEAFYTPSVLQTAPEQTYAPRPGCEIASVVGITNGTRMVECYSCWNEQDYERLANAPKKGDRSFAGVKRIVFRNIHLLPSEELMTKKDLSFVNGYMVNVFPQTYFDGVVVEDIRLCGRPVPAEDMKIGMVGEDRIDRTYL